MMRPVLATSGVFLVCVVVGGAPAMASPTPLCQQEPNDPLCVYKQFGAGEGTSAEVDPFLCRFGAGEEAPGPVLLAATREDCTRAGGAVMTPQGADVQPGE